MYEYISYIFGSVRFEAEHIKIRYSNDVTIYYYFMSYKEFIKNDPDIWEKDQSLFKA